MIVECLCSRVEDVENADNSVLAFELSEATVWVFLGTSCVDSPSRVGRPEVTELVLAESAEVRVDQEPPAGLVSNGDLFSAGDWFPRRRAVIWAVVGVDVSSVDLTSAAAMAIVPSE